MTFTARRITLVLLTVSVSVAAGCSSSKKALPASTTTSVARPTTTTASTTTSSTTTTLPSAPWIAVWPTVASGDRFGDPVVAARTFATGYLHFVTPVVGAFQQGDSRSGEVPIRSKSTGPVTTILVRQLGTDGSWSVLGATTPNIVLTQPAALATIRSPVRLRGSSSAFEGTVQVSIRQDDIATPLAQGFVTGGSLQMGPFDSTFTFPAPTSSYGAIVLDTVSPEDGHVAEATVIRVRLG